MCMYYDIQIVQVHLYRINRYLIHASSDGLGKMVETTVTAIAVFALAFYYSWELAMLVAAFIPLLVLG